MKNHRFPEETHNFENFFKFGELVILHLTAKRKYNIGTRVEKLEPVFVVDLSNI